MTDNVACLNDHCDHQACGCKDHCIMLPCARVRNSIADSIRTGYCDGKTPGELADDIVGLMLAAALEDGDPELGEKVAAYDASVDWVARGYADPRISFEAGAAWHRTRHDPLCACGETLPGPCIRRYPEGHNAVKCSGVFARPPRSMLSVTDTALRRKEMEC